MPGANGETLRRGGPGGTRKSLRRLQVEAKRDLARALRAGPCGTSSTTRSTNLWPRSGTRSGSLRSSERQAVRAYTVWHAGRDCHRPSTHPTPRRGRQPHGCREVPPPRLAHPLGIRRRGSCAPRSGRGTRAPRAGGCAGRGVTAGARSYLRYTDPGIFGDRVAMVRRPKGAPVARTDAAYWPPRPDADTREPPA